MFYDAQGVDVQEDAEMHDPMPDQPAAQGPDMPSYASKPEVGEQLELFRREVNQMGGAIHYHIGEVRSTNAQLLNRMLEQTRAESRAVLESVALQLMEHGRQNERPNLVVINQHRVQLQNGLRNYMHIMGQIDMFNTQYVRNIVEIIQQHRNIRQQSVQQILQQHLQQQVVVHKGGN